MDHQPHNLDPIEQMLLEADRADQAGVFGRTSLDVSALVGGRPAAAASWFRRHRQALVGLPVAACLGFVAVVGTLRYAGGTASDAPQVAINGAAVPGSFDMRTPQMAEVLFSCFTGPGQGPISSECASADYDGDGDVDLVDFGVLQLAEDTGP